ncbi:MAG TPA: hypothetical protein VFX15_09780 [Actinomycetes bacterium]|nr:hypothetical protein [Actinomycetes bacterium]
MSIEERLMRDIATVTRGVTVSEQDLLDAREQVDDIVESQTRRDRFMRVAGAAAAAVVVAGVGYAAVQSMSEDGTAVPAGPAPTVEDPYAHYLNGTDPTPELIAGFWRLDNGGLSVIFKEDGTMQFSEEGMVYSQPQAFGTYEIEGDSINMTFAGGVSCEGVHQNMRASLTKQGNMHSVADEASGGNCTPLSTYQSNWEHVLPPGPGFDFAPSTAKGWKPLDGQDLQGDWAAEGGGYVLEMSPDGGKTPHGSYYILDEWAEPVDEGQWSLQGNDLVLTSLARSASCSPGDQFVLGNVETTDEPGTPVIRGTVEENACGGAWTPKSWFLIPHDGSGN